MFELGYILAMTECIHKPYVHHRGEALDTMKCSLCNTFWYVFYGKHQVGSILSLPNSQRPPGSQDFWINPDGTKELAPDWPE